MGGWYEIRVTDSTETIRQYYSIAGMSIGMREGGTVSYFLTDHLGSLVSGNCGAHGDTLKAWAFTYDGDGNRVKQIYTDISSTLTTYYFMGGSYEVQVAGSTETVRQYYSIAGMAIGMREGETVNDFLTDHLGSVVGVTNSSGALISEVRYLPFGEIRTDVGSTGGITQTDFGYTFQRALPDLGLLDYKARFYSLGGWAVYQRGHDGSRPRQFEIV